LDNSLSMIKAPSAMMLSLAIASMISPAEAAASCTSSSPQCCWVVRSYQLMGRTTSVSSTSSTACCRNLGSTTQTSGIPGVTCTSTGTVTGIQWVKFALPGIIPSDIGNLVNLTYLRLQWNQLTGSIPASIGNLKSLTELVLAYNQLSGSIPASIGNLVNLGYLGFHVNRLTGIIPPSIGNLTKLQQLIMRDNRLSGIIPPSIGNLVNLFNLELHNNTLSGSIPDSIGNLVKLTKIQLYDNQLSGPIPDSIGNLVNLQMLHIQKNRLSGEIPTEIGNLVNLFNLRLHNNTLSGSIPDSIGGLVNLTELSLAQNLGLNGTFTPRCSIAVYASGTSVVICGCSSGISSAAVFPLPDTSEECLASGSATSLRKRTPVFSSVIGSYQYTCNLDSNGNPYQNCLNTMAKICHPNYIGNNITRIDACKIGVNSMTLMMNPSWQNVRKACGQWSWNGMIGNVDSLSCTSANSALQANAFYVLPDLTKVPVNASLTDSINIGLWRNQVLRE